MQHLAIAKEVGDRAGEGRAYTDLGMQVAGDLSKAIEYHAQHPATAKEVGDRAGKGAAYGNLGKAYPSLGDYSSLWQRTIPLSGNARNAGVRAGGVGAHPILRGSRASALALRTQCGTHCSTQCGTPRGLGLEEWRSSDFDWQGVATVKCPASSTNTRSSPGSAGQRGC
jgi:hypothetical protein